MQIYSEASCMHTSADCDIVLEVRNKLLTETETDCKIIYGHAVWYLCLLESYALYTHF